MNDINAYLYPTALDEEQKRTVREMLHARRSILVDSLLGQLQSPEMGERLGTRAGAMQGFVSELLALAERAPAQVTELLSSWSPTTLLNGLTQPELRGPQLEQLVGNLQALLLGGHLAGQLESQTARFVTPPELYDLWRGTRLQVKNVPAGASVEWAISGTTLTLRVVGQSSPLATLSLPLQGEGAVTCTPLPWSRSWNVPIIEESQVLGLSGRTPQELQDETLMDPGWTPLTLLESAEAAHAIVRDLWPEALDWSPLLFTALVDMNGPPSRSVHRSASYGPGSAILVTRVDDPFKHAEDIIHEMQHQRMLLVMDTTMFGKWDDLRQNVASPYRSDPRPLRGLHLGIHAFLAVNRLRLRQHARAGYPKERFRYLLNAHRTNLFSFRTLLEHETIAPHGRAAFAEYARELVSQHELIEPMVPRDMSEAFDQHLRKHILEVKQRASEPILNLGEQYLDWNGTARLAARYAETLEAP